MTGEELIEIIKHAGFENKEVYVRTMDGSIEEVTGTDVDGKYGVIETEEH